MGISRSPKSYRSRIPEVLATSATEDDIVFSNYQKKGGSKLAKRTNIRTFGRALWKSVQSRITPTPRGLRAEVNPDLKRHYSNENRTLIFRLNLNSLTNSGMSQYYYGTSRGAEVGASYTSLIQNKRAAKSEFQAQQQMVKETQEHIQKMESSEKITEQTSTTGAGYEKQLRAQEQDKTDLAEQQQQVEAKEKQVEKLKEAEQVMTQKPTEAEAGKVESAQETRQEKKQDTEIKGPKDEQPRAQREKAISPDRSTRTGEAAQPADQQTEQFVEQEVGKAQQQKLNTFKNLLKNDVLSKYQARIVKQPELLATAPAEGQGEQIVMHIDPNSFNDTKRINANWRGISFGRDTVSANYSRYY